MRRNGLYECTSCHWLFVRSRGKWRGAIWPRTNGTKGIRTRKNGKRVLLFLEGYLSEIPDMQNEYADCWHKLKRI